MVNQELTQFEEPLVMKTNFYRWKEKLQFSGVEEGNKCTYKLGALWSQN